MEGLHLLPPDHFDKKYVFEIEDSDESDSDDEDEDDISVSNLDFPHGHD